MNQYSYLVLMLTAIMNVGKGVPNDDQRMTPRHRYHLVTALLILIGITLEMW